MLFLSKQFTFKKQRIGVINVSVSLKYLFMLSKQTQQLLFAFLLTCGFFMLKSPLFAQNYYGLSNTGELYVFNPTTCTSCSAGVLSGINPINLFNNGDIFVMPNGNILVTQGTQLLVYDPPSLTPIFSSTGIVYSGTAAGPGNLIYMIGGSTSPPSLYTFNPTTNAITLVGAFPAGVSSLSDLFYFNNQLYAVGFLTVLLVNPTNPALSTPTGNFFNTDFAIADEGFFIGLDFGSPIFGQYNPTTNTSTVICPIPPVPTFISLQQIPPSAPQISCGCSTNAGTLSPAAINLCVPSSVTVPYNNNAVLDANDILQYVVLTNPANPASSIIATNSTGIFAYNAALFTPGVTYYVATVAGNNQGGAVNLTDPCLDFSNFVLVVWRPKPTVTFTLTNPSACNTVCADYTATFTGTPPFQLSVEVLQGATVVNNFTTTFNTTPALLQFCPPAGNPTGSFLVRATSLTDAFCTCN
jgi:hypothetical protein